MKLIKISVFCILIIVFSSFKTPIDGLNTSNYDVSQFYVAMEPDDDVKVLTTGGDLEDAELILVPTKIDEGVYEIEITKKGSNLYKLEGTKYYIETRYCYEYASYEDAILKVTSNYGYTKGTVMFK